MGIFNWGKGKMGNINEEVILQLLHAIKRDIEQIKNGQNHTPAKKTAGDSKVAKHMMGVWNNFCDMYPHYRLSKVSSLSDKRIRGVNARVKEKEFDIVRILKVIRLCPFLLGRGSGVTCWKVNFDFIFCYTDKWIKIMEGQYVDENKRREFNTILNEIPKNILDQLPPHFLEEISTIGSIK